jgi:TolB-like protein
VKPSEVETSTQRVGREMSGASPSAEDVIAQLERMLEGVSFKASPRRQEMLRFIVDETLAGRGDRLKGVTVAISVFGRDETFDQQSDPIVRLEARRLRSDLDSYYVDAGIQDPVRITIPKGGYVPHFEWQHQEALAPTGDPAVTSSTGAGNEITSRRGRLILATALLAIGGLVAITAVFGLRGAEPVSTTARTPAIIVLPFDAFGDNENIELIASGVTGELISNLMLFKDFRVFSANASFRQVAGTDPEILRRELGAAFAVIGVMQSQGGRIYLRARLVDTETGEVRWSGSYDQPLDAGDLLGAQHDLAVAISTELGEPYGAVNQAIGQRMARERSPTMPSYTCILRAYDYRQNFDEALYAPAMACLTETVMRDPDYADAWAMLGWLHLDAVRMRIAPEADRLAEMAAALDAAEHAVDLDPDSPRTLAALSAIRFYRGDYAAAEVLQRKVLALNPHDPDTLAQLGWRLAVRGNREGLTYLEQAVARSANAPGWYYLLLSIYAYLDGDYARTLDTAKKSTNAVGLSLAAMSHAKLGDIEAARANLEAMAEVWPLLGRDPAAAYRTHHTSEAIVDALVQGLREAGWTPPDAEL